MGGSNPPVPAATPSAAIVVVGNEVLSAKVRDDNSPFLLERLRALGVRVERVTVVPDRLDVLVAEYRALLPAFTWVFSTGGVGPTHDDITMEAIARAVDRPLVEDASLLKVIHEYFGAGCTPFHLKMARVPEGTELVYPPGAKYPVVLVGNLWVFPGSPELVRRKFLSIEARFRVEPFRLRKVYFRVDEALIAELLERTERDTPGIAIGSYPLHGNAEYDVMVTIEGKDAAGVDGATDRIAAGAPAGALVRVE